MDRQQLQEFQQQVKSLHVDGKTIRAIASELGVPKSNVYRATKALSNKSPDKKSISPFSDKKNSPVPPSIGMFARAGASKSPLNRAFVGRSDEMLEIRRALDQSVAGRPRLLMLAGEPGIGKTRVCREIAGYAEELGAQVLQGRCYENVGSPPYWPWVQAISAYVNECDSERLHSEMGAGASDISEIVPALLTKLPGLKPSAKLEPEQERMRLFDSIVTFLKAATVSQPIMLVLENLHWSDVSSLLLLEFATQELGDSRILTVGTYRDTEVSLDHPLSRTLGELTKEPHFQRLRLGGLTQEDVSALINLATGVTPSPSLAEHVHSRTGGNPLFVTEVVRLLASDRAVNANAKLDSATNAETLNVKIPDGVREAIGTRLYRMSPETQRFLSIASVVGREFGLDFLNRLMPDIDVDDLMEALDEALATQVIEEISGGFGGYQFGHALIQETLYSELSSTRRAQLHASIAGALEEQYGSDFSRHASELAYHFARAEAVTGTRKAVSYSLLAGEQALEAYAWEEALAHFQLGLKAKRLDVTTLMSAPDQVSADLLFGLGRAQVAIAQSSQSTDAVTSFTLAFNQYVSSGDAERAVAIAVYPMPLIAGYVTGKGELIKQALSLVPADSIQAGRLQASYGRVKGLEEVDYEAADQAFSIALDIARQNDDAGLELQTLSFACDVDGYHTRMTEALGKGLRAVELASQIDNPRAELMAHMWCFSSLATNGDLPGATRHALAMLPLWERLRHPEYGSRALYAAGTAHRLAGAFDSALEFSDRGLAAAPHDPRLLQLKILLEFDLGNFEEGRVYLDRFVDVAKQSVPGPNVERAFSALVIAICMRVSKLDDLTGIAEEFNTAVLNSPTSTPSVTAFARIGSSLLSVFQRDTLAAAEHYNVLAESQAVGYSSMIGVPEGRILGLLVNPAGWPEQAAAHFEDGLSFCRKGGYKPALAWTCHDFAEALLNLSSQSGRREEQTRTKVASLLDEALTISIELGMRPLKESTIALEELAADQFGPGPAYPDGLTAREVEVLGLIATGLSNREIAAELVLSARTVERHITNIYGKIGSRGRADATNYALGHKLLAED